MPRKYDVSAYRKHKRPLAWGSPCPDEIDNAHAQRLLDSGVQVQDVIWNVDGDRCFRAFAHDRDGDTSRWHGHPIPWSRLPVEAKRKLIEIGRLDDAKFRKALRKRWGSES